MGEEAALSRAWVLTALFVLAAVVWVSWMLWDYHRSAALRLPAGPASPAATATLPIAPAETMRPPGAEAVPAPRPVAPVVTAVRDSAAAAPAPSLPLAHAVEAPRVESPPPAVATVPAPTTPSTAAEPVATRPDPAPPKPAVPRPARAADRPAAPATAPVTKKAVAAPVLGLLCGRVADENHEPVVGARVFLADLAVGIATDGNGGFCVSAPLGERTVSIVALGFETSRQVVVVGPQTHEILVTLRSSPPADPH